jgi:hypothetical protein
MKVEHLRTVGDGFCFNGTWPMWSQILSEILDCEWKNFSLPGLGNEAMANLVIDQLHSENLPNTLWIIQWTFHDRVDFRIDSANTEFLKQIAEDPIYYKNFITTAQGRTYWSSNASILPWVKQHKDLIGQFQFQDRSRLFEMAVTHSLENSKVQWQYISTPDMMKFVKTSKHLHLDVGEIQPVSSIHLEFVEQQILPGLDYDQNRLETIRKQYLDLDNQRKMDGNYVPWDRNMYNKV